MRDNYIYYEYDGERYKVPFNERKKFESLAPDAKIQLTYDGENYKVPLNELDSFVNTVGDISSLSFSSYKKDDYSAKGSTTPFSFLSQEEVVVQEPAATQDNKPSFWQRVGESMIRAQNEGFDVDVDKEDTGEDKTSIFETIGKATGAAGTTIGKWGVDAVNTGAKMGRKRPTYGNPLTGLGATIEAITGKSLFDKEAPLNQASEKMEDTIEKLSLEADPTHGEMGYGELLKEGKVGMAAQKALASGIESLPIMIGASTGPIGMTIIGAGMAASNYANDERENPEVEDWKRGMYAIGTAVTELAVERLGGPLNKLFGKGGQLTKEAVENAITQIRKEGIKTLKERILGVLKNIGKEGLEEGGEELLTSFGNDALGEALDAIEGNKDYGIRAQWAKYKEQNPDATVEDFANAKVNEYSEAFLGGFLSGVEISGVSTTANEVTTNRHREQMNAARAKGSTLGLANMYDIDEMLKEQGDATEKAFVDEESGRKLLSREFIDNMTAEDAFELSREEDLSNQQRVALRQLANAKAMEEGLTTSLDNSLTSTIDTQKAHIEKAAENGKIVVGTVNGQPVYVKGAVVQNGSLTLPTGENGPVIIINAVTGEESSVNTNEIANFTSRDAAEYAGWVEAMFMDKDHKDRQTARTTMSVGAKLKAVTPYAGKKMYVDFGNGLIEVGVQRVLPTGEVIIQGKKGDLGGQSIKTIGVGAFYDSIYRDENGNPMFVEGELEPVEEQTTEGQPTTEQPSDVNNGNDYREQTVEILINGKPVSVNVISQDNTANRITYEYVDENGNTRTGGSTISEFESAIQQASQYQPAPEAPVVEEPAPEEPQQQVVEEEPTPQAPEEIPVTPETIDWDALFVQDPEAYFIELQNQFGEEAMDILNEEIAAAQNELDALSKAKTKSQNERLANRQKKAGLQNRINILNGMITRLTPAPEVVAETPVEEAPVPVEEAPVAETPVEPVEETPAEPEVAPETPVEEVPAEPAAPAEPVEEAPVQPEPQATPVAPIQVDNPIVEAQKRERSLATQLKRVGIPHEKKQDMAYNAGKAVGDFFATREEYEAYAENATDLGEYNADFERGVEDSFANRQQNTGETPVNSVPLENEPKGENNREQGNGEVGTGQPTDSGVQGASDGEGQGDDKGNQSEKGSKSQGKNNKGKKKVGNKYPARKGNVTGQDLIDTFGFASVTIPNKRKTTLNTIYDFMMEMSKMLGISPKSIGHGGWLTVSNLKENSNAVARHALSYDVLGNVVDVSLKYKYADLRSIAHEWWHSLDYALQYFNTGKITDTTGYLTGPTSEVSDKKFSGRKEVLDAVRDVIKAIKESGHEQRIIDANPTNLSYWISPREMSARAFEAYIQDKFDKAGIVIDGTSYPFRHAQPTAEEMAVIAPAFDKLFEVLQEKEGKTPGTSVLFQIGEMVDKNNEASQLATENIINVLRDSKIEVVKLTDENVEQMIPLSKVDGTIYGWTDGKKIYLTEAGINPNTPIHEYTHLWAKAMMQNNPKGWQSVKDLLRGTAIWDEVMNDTNYSNIHNDEDAVASEALSRISGRDGAAKMEQMAQQMIDEAKGAARKLEARGLIQRMKDALNEFWSWVGTELFGIEKFESVEQVTDRVLWDLMNATDLGELSEGQVETQIVTDPKVISELEASPKRTGYRNVVMNEDGTFSSPMAYWLQSPKGGAKTRVETAKFELGKWEEAEEHTDLVDERGHITLVKPNKGTIDVAYDPYIHNRLDPVNLQFKDAWKRNDLVYVETEVPETDLESGYHADKALLSVGVHSWSNGDVMLSKYDKPVRVMPWEEVADAWVARLNGEGVHFDVVPPALLPLLVERGVEILPPHKGMGKDCNDAYAEWKKENPQSDSRDLTSSQSPKVELNQTAERAQTKDAAKIQKSIESLRELARVSKIIKESRPKVLVDALAEALNIDPSQRRNKSKRNKYTLPNGETLSVRASDHNTDSNTYIEFNFNQNYNLAITFKSKHSQNTFKANENVRLDEYVYFVEDIKQYNGSVLSEVAASLADFLESGIYEDTTGLVTINTSPEGVAPRTKENYSEIKLRKSYAQNAAVDNLVGEARLRAIEHAVDAEASKLGVKVTYKTREQMPKGHHNEKGYYNPNTGEIVVCTENASSIADAIQTILHEAVAHKGLRELMGDRFNEFINRVYESLDAETKAKVDARAAAEYGGDTAVAMEEYMATLAESTDFNNDTLWDKIKSIFEDIINAILGRNDIKIGDNELRYILRASYNNMVNPRGMETVRGWAQDQMMRENYGVNLTPAAQIAQMDAEYMRAVREGDMETAQRLVNEAAKIAMPNTTVVDENGNPKVVYHGTSKEFFVFGEDLSGKRSHTEEGSYYFNDNPEVAATYGERVIPAFVNIENPLVEDFEGRSWRNLTLGGIDVVYNRTGAVLQSGFATKEEAEAWREQFLADNPAYAKDADYVGVSEGLVTGVGLSSDEYVRMAMEAGNDGAILNNITDSADIEHTETVVNDYVAFSSRQVKSAEPVTYDDEGNVIPLSKRFNLENDDIRYRTGIDPTEAAAQTAKEVYDNTVQDNWQEFQRQFQDAMQPVRIAIDAIQQETGNVPIEDYENYILIQNQASSRSRVEIDEFHRKYYSPIIEQVNAIIDKIMKARGYKINDKERRAEVYAEVKQYLISKHGLERNAYYQSTKTKMVDGEEVQDMRDYSGLTTLFGMSPRDFEAAEAAAQECVDKFEAEVGDATDALWKKINAATSKTLRHSYECGIISRQQYEDINGMFDFYIPLRGFDETTAEDVYTYARFEGNRFSAAVQTAKGRTSLANDPIAYIMNMAESEIAQGNKNRAKQALYHFILNRPVTDADGNQTQNSLMQVENVWYVKSVDGFGREVYTIAHPDHAAGETMQEFEAKMKALAETGKAVKSKKGKVDVGMRFQKPTHANEHYIYLKVNGVEKAIYVNGNPKAAQAVNGTFAEPLGEGAQRFRDVQRALSQTFTNYSIEFTARNYMRDLIYSHINIGVKESDPAYRRRFRQNWRKNNLGTMLKLIKAYRAGELEGRQLTEVEAAFVEFMANGGQTGYTLINSIEAHKRDLERAIENMQKGVVNGGVKDSTIFKFTLGNVELLNEASELVTRFAAFKTSRDMGRSIARSISDAKEVTVNFNTRGAQDGKGWMGVAARYLGWSKFFFNASVQGVQNITAMAKANKLKFCGVVGGVAATGFMMPLLTGVIYGMLSGDDDDEKNPYWNIPEYERQNNFCVVIGDGKYVKIPLPIGFREIYALGDMTAALVFDKTFRRDATRVGVDMANKIASIVLPINPLEGSVNGLSLWHTALNTGLPSSLQFVVQNATNIDWKGAPIQKEYQYNKDDPQWMKAFSSNPEWMVGLSKWCNEHIGTGDMKGMDWSPEKLDNTLSNLFGGIYSLVKKTGNSFSMIWNEENRNLSNIPLAGVILGSGADSDDRYMTNEYYEGKEYYDDRIGFIKRRAEKFGYDLDDVFKKEKGKQNPKMHEIYGNKEYEFMKTWYLGHEGNPNGESKQERYGLNKLHNNINKLEKRMKQHPNPLGEERLQVLNREFEKYQEDFVKKMIEIE